MHNEFSDKQIVDYMFLHFRLPEVVRDVPGVVVKAGYWALHTEFLGGGVPGKTVRSNVFYVDC
jgi:hypothetical protein